MTSTTMYGVATVMIGKRSKKQVSEGLFLRASTHGKEIVVYFILVFSYSKIIKLLGSNKSNYGSDYRVVLS